MNEAKEETQEASKTQQISKGVQQAGSNADSNIRSKPEVYKPIDDANLAAKRLEDATKAQREENDRTETLLAKKTLGGNSQGAEQIAEKKEETPAEYKDRIMRGGV